MAGETAVSGVFKTVNAASDLRIEADFIMSGSRGVEDWEKLRPDGVGGLGNLEEDGLE
jgi:hypothetical protein